jgi:hypothetical protein
LPTRLALAVRRSEPRIECYVAYLGKTSPVSSVDVARAVAAILDNPTPRIGHIFGVARRLPDRAAQPARFLRHRRHALVRGGAQ